MPNWTHNIRYLVFVRPDPDTEPGREHLWAVDHYDKNGRWLCTHPWLSHAEALAKARSIRRRLRKAEEYEERKKNAVRE